MRRMLLLVVMLVSALVVADAYAAPFHSQDFDTPQAPAPSAARHNRSAQAQPSPSANVDSATTAPARILRRSETDHFDNWVVKCDEFADAPKKRACSARLEAEQSGNTRIILIWTMYINDAKHLIGVLQTLTGVMIAPGVEVELGRDKSKYSGNDKAKEKESSPRRFVYESCDPTRCFATLSLDSAFIRDAIAAPTATVIIRAINGSTVRISFPIKGFDKAYAQLRANAG